MIPVVKGNIETINQALALLEALDNKAYCHISAPYINSSIGQHVRHIIDNYLVIVDGVSQKHINYNIRRRGAAVETCIETAKKELNDIQIWLHTIDSNALTTSLSIFSEVCLEQEQSDHLVSSLHRELIFVASHCIHHMALIGVAVKLQNIDTPKHFGLAPATATYVRQQESQGTANS